MFSGSLETLQLTGAQHAKIGTYIRMESGQIRRVYVYMVCLGSRDAGLTLLSYDGHEFFVT